MKTGLLIVDMQESIVRQKMDQKAIDHACEYINHVANVLRSNDHVVVHIQDVEGMEGAEPEQYQVISEIDVDGEDITITKESSNAFWQTNLEQTLKDLGVELLIVSGFAAEECVLFTYNGAMERGFRPVMLQNGILSTHPEVISSTYRDRNVISYPVVDYLIG
ncbi:Nicotinamidase-related amidase [Paenibacillus polysaccharolyticus]|uniref:Nicotinamidase-related amidase n=1 Tax=Paenibacillus polysaccharolyticus TaxID=582692 RepID=A0A1G5JLS0_9BACL|nr:isochorismatase family cysteine hydrolase [Paenibacillus polysaccharolyticus]SCY88850.1 Nicotinamidase-related amidase [Paenibacillus polysaccharolyticus]